MGSHQVNGINAWLISPEGKWCYRFHRDPMSWERYPFIFVDRWSALPNGVPSQMKKRNKLPLDEALELCGQMLLDGWLKLTTQLNEEKITKLTEESVA